MLPGGRGGGAPQTGPGYAFTPEQLTSIATEWDELADKFESCRTHVRTIEAVEAPGTEYASINNADKIRQSGAALQVALDERVNYCRAMAQKFRNALPAYTTVDEDTAAVVTEKKGTLR
ncbi:hypothetical protein BAY60_06890 [Prauserella muralis]|uniref:PE family protein n=1 Tax=Prauserella muralis TaxID=588067 RepID=A0A2V4BBP7_9PSEU|nr:hypothetical protein BAY60_06890 [Prauserella muralis]